VYWKVHEHSKSKPNEEVRSKDEDSAEQSILVEFEARDWRGRECTDGT
jgi:hypothetical protein